MDPVFTEIMRSRFAAIAEEASTVAYRTAHTTFVKQTQDFQVAVARVSGEFFAYPMLTGVVSGGGQTISGLTGHFPVETLEPGDVFISNCPFSTRGLVTHMMDIHLAMPIFYRGRLACYAWSFVHASDIGGAVPGSISPELSEAFQEGLRLRPAKLVSGGRLNRDLANVIRDNSRIGDAVWGDLEALMAAMRLLEKRIVELCDKIGFDDFLRGVDQVMDYAEFKARRVISGLRDGRFEFTDYIEGLADGDFLNICCTLTVDGDEASIDYSGSSPQVAAAFNYSTGSRTHPFLCLGLTNYIQTVERDIPINGGIIRPIRAFAPEGSIMNAEFPAAMGNRFVTVMRTYDALIGCLNQAIPGGIAACGAGQAGIISAAWPDPRLGRNRVAVIEPFSGGSGGRVRADGVDANDTMIGFLKSTPIEHVEAETPVLVRRHALVPDSFGHGRHRGGSAVHITVQSRAPELSVTVRGLDRFTFAPWGAFGGTPGRTCSTRLDTGEGSRALGRIRLLQLKRGDTLDLLSSSGGGFGPPVAREAGSVLRDVLDGLLSAELAREVYGVVVKDGAVDQPATDALRAGMQKEAQTDAFFHGERRHAYEAHWPIEAARQLSDSVLALPRGVRRFVRDSVRTGLDLQHAPVDVQQVRDAVQLASETSGVV